jgi:hypothetical protein
MIRRFASNAAANVFSGAMAAAYQLSVTGMGARVWHGSEFSSWALAFSIAAIAPIFAANLSSVVTRRVVEARHKTRDTTESAIVRAGRRVGRHLAWTAIATLMLAGVLVQRHSASTDLSALDFWILLTAMLVTNCWLLLWQVRFGQYYAEERNWLPALTLAIARMSGVAGMMFGLSAGNQGLIYAAVGLCVGTWTGLAISRVFLLRPSVTAASNTVPSRPEIRQQYRANLNLLSGFAVGAVSMLVIQYSIPPIMALIAPERFNAFYLANTLNMVAVSFLAAAMSAMLAPMTRWRMSGRAEFLRKVAFFSPVVCALSCLLVLSLCWYAMGPVLSAVEVRAANVDDIRTFLAILGFQTIIRNAAAGYAIYIASTGTSSQIAVPLVIEITLAFTLAIPLGWLYGENALLLGLILSGLIGSLCSSWVLAALPGEQRMPAQAAFRSLLLAQLSVCCGWWFIVKTSL